MTSPIPDVTARIRVDTSSLDRARNAVQDFGRALDRSSSNADRAGTRITGALKFPALISGASLAATAVSALGAGFVALVGAAAPAAGVLAALPVAYSAVGQAAGVAQLALRGVEDRVKELAKAQGPRQLTAETEAFAQALAGPATSALNDLSDAAARATLPGVQAALERVVAVAPRLTGVIDATGGALGRLAIATADVAVAQMPLLERVLLANVPLLETMGAAGLVLAPAFLQVVEAAQPMVALLADAALRGAEFVAAAVDAGAESGRLAGFFLRAYDVAAQLGSILGDLAVGLFNVFSGGADSGGRLLDSLERLASRFRAFTESASGQNKIEKYFREAEPVIEESARLVGAVVLAFGGLADNRGLTSVLKQLRTDLLPALEDLLRAVSDAFAPNLVSLAESFVRVLTALGGEGSALDIIVSALAGIAKFAAKMVETVPGLKELVAVIGLVAFGVKAAAAVTAVWAAAQAALNFAFALSPLGLIALAVGVLAAAVVVAYRNSDTFRDAVNRLWGALKVAGEWVVDLGKKLTVWVIDKVLEARDKANTFRDGLSAAFDVVAKAATKMWEQGIRPAFAFVVEAFLDLVGAIIDGAAKAFGWVPGLGPKLKDASVKFSEFAQETNRALGAIKDKDIKVSATATLLGAGRNADGSYRIAGQGSQGGVALATGGAVRGPGTRTSDSIAARLSNDEHVWTADEVDGAGGHGAVERLRTVAKRGMLPGFARGGRVQFQQTLPDPDDLARPVRGLVDGLGDALSRAAAALVQQAADSENTQSSPAGRGSLGPRARTAFDAVREVFGFTGTIGGYSNRNIAGTNTLSKHALGKAIDVMTYSNKALGQRIADFFVQNRSQYGVDNVIFNRRIANARRGWNYGAYSGQNPHTDHPHIDFFDKGGVARGLGYMPKLTSAPERVLSPVQTASFERLVDLLPTLVGGQTDALLRELLQATRENTQAVRSAPLAAVDRGTMYGRKGLGVG